MTATHKNIIKRNLLDVIAFIETTDPDRVWSITSPCN